MFKGEKTTLFWAGLLLLGFASVVLFSAVWYIPFHSLDLGDNFYWFMRSNLPPIVCGIVFILIGFYMMRSGVKRGQPPT